MLIYQFGDWPFQSYVELSLTSDAHLVSGSSRVPLEIKCLMGGIVTSLM